MTRVKICGITRPEDALFCAEQGADFIGFVFVKSSPRYIDPVECGSLLPLSKRRQAAAVQRVGVFRDATVEEIERVATSARLDFVQLHGSEGDDVIERLTLPVIKAFRVDGAMPEVSTIAEWVMFDSGGGTGRVFDWKLLQDYQGKPFFLAGGITPENVAAAITLRPYAIDVSSGVEKEPGVKDHDKVRRLIEQVRQS